MELSLTLMGCIEMMLMNDSSDAKGGGWERMVLKEGRLGDGEEGARSKYGCRVIGRKLADVMKHDEVGAG